MKHSKSEHGTLMAFTNGESIGLPTPLLDYDFSYEFSTYGIYSLLLFFLRFDWVGLCKHDENYAQTYVIMKSNTQNL